MSVPYGRVLLEPGHITQQHHPGPSIIPIRLSSQAQLCNYQVPTPFMYPGGKILGDIHVIACLRVYALNCTVNIEVHDITHR